MMRSVIRFILGGCLVVAMAAGADDRVNQGFDYMKEKDYDAAYQTWLAAAEDGDMVAQLNVGNLYYEGRGTDKNPGVAAIWWARSAAQGMEVARWAMTHIKLVDLALKSEAVSLYRSGSSDSDVIYTLTAANTAQVLAVSEDWYMVYVADVPAYGFVAADSVTLLNR